MRRRIKNTPSHIFFLITKKDTLEQFSLKQHHLFRKTIVIFVLIKNLIVYTYGEN